MARSLPPSRSDQVFVLQLKLLALMGLAAAMPGGLLAQTPVELDPAEAARLAPAGGAVSPAPIARVTEAIRGEGVERYRALRRSMAPRRTSNEEFRLRALEGFIDVDEEEEILYNPGRTQIISGRYFLEADRVIFDNRLQEVQAEGNVIFRVRDGETEVDEILADSMRYNFADSEGVAFNVKGRHAPLYFAATAAAEDESPSLAAFQQLSREESLFRDTAFTTCDFKVPHYRLRAREVILFTDDRIFFRGATFYAMDVPVLYLPFYTRSLRRGSPWFVQLGSGNRTGARVRIGYEYEHETREPTFEDDDQFEVRSRGEAQVFTDILSKRGLGGGGRYKYKYEYDRHQGEFEVYGIHDVEREVGESFETADPATEDEPERWQILWRHRSEITEDLSVVVNVDMFSDPEIFFDILDKFTDGEFERERPIERRARAAITYLKEAYVARLTIDLKDRIGIDRYGDPSEAGDNDRDFDFDPGALLRDSEANSIANSRWGRVSERLPQFDFATRHLPVRNWPLYINTELHAYNNLDKGINVVDTDDDAMVRGIEVYNQLLWQHKITERYILLAKLGVGFGAAERDDDDLGVVPRQLSSFDALRVIDTDDTFLIGEDEFNFDDIETFYSFIDAALRLNVRFSDALTAFIEWRWRETTDGFIGDFYAEIGDLTSREDLYNYRLREHWLVANLTYLLLHPQLEVFANTGVNLASASELYPNERTGFWNVGFRYANTRRTLRLTSSVGQTHRQVRHPSDEREGEREFVFFQTNAEYAPQHGRWYTRLRLRRFDSSGEATEASDSDRFTFFSDEEDRTRVTWTYGLELGPKWETELRLKWDDRVDGLRAIEWILQRDLHDALAILKVSSKRDITDADDREDDGQELDFSLGIKFKLPDQEVSFGASEITTLRHKGREPVRAY